MIKAYCNSGYCEIVESYDETLIKLAIVTNKFITTFSNTVDIPLAKDVCSTLKHG